MRLHLCRTLMNINEDDDIVYLSLPLCHLTSSQQEKVLDMLQSCIRPHQIIVVVTTNAVDRTRDFQDLFQIENSELKLLAAEIHGFKESELYLDEWTND